MNIALRQVEPADSARMLAWRNLPEVARYMYSDHVISQREHDAWFSKMLADPTSDYRIVEIDGVPVGVAGVYEIDLHNQRASWAFYIASPGGRGRGVGSVVESWMLRHAFETLGLHKLCCEVLDSNPAVTRMHEGFGFVQEGTLRQHRKKGGVLHDVVQLSMLRSEWVSSARAAAEERLRRKGLTLPSPAGT